MSIGSWLRLLDLLRHNGVKLGELLRTGYSTRQTQLPLCSLCTGLSTIVMDHRQAMPSYSSLIC